MLYFKIKTKEQENAEMKKNKLGIVALTLALTTVFVSCTSPVTEAPENGSDTGFVEENYSEIEAESDEDGGSEGTASFVDGNEYDLADPKDRQKPRRLR